MPAGKTLVIADDDENLNRLITFKLKRAGYSVISTADGKAALQAAMEEGVDGVILDIMMPFLDGIQVLKQIRQQRPGLPVMLLSVKSRERDLDLGLEMGASDYMSKPFQLEELVQRVGSMLGEA